MYAIPTATIAHGTTENDVVISATMIITASGACATLPKHAIMPTTTNTPGLSGSHGACTNSPSRQIAAPVNPPITMPGPKMPPDPPVPIDSDVATIFATGRMSTIHNGIAINVSRAAAACAQPYPLDSTWGSPSAMSPTANPPIAG